MRSRRVLCAVLLAGSLGAWKAPAAQRWVRLDGVAVAGGAVEGADLAVYSREGALLGRFPAATNWAGRFLVAVPESASGYRVVARGGRTGEAAFPGTLAAQLEPAAAAARVVLDPLTTVVDARVRRGEPLAAATAAVEASFGIPSDPGLRGVAGRRSPWFDGRRFLAVAEGFGGFDALVGSLAESGPAGSPQLRAVQPMAAGATFLVSVAGAVAGKVVNAVLDKIGLFEVLGLGGPDRWTRRMLTEIMAKIDHLEVEIHWLAAKMQELELRQVTVPARNTIAAQQAAFETCYDRLKDLATVPVDEPESVEVHNRALLARAYQVVALPPPTPGLMVEDTYCAILEPLKLVQTTVLPPGPGADRPLLDMARLARQKGESFEEVAAYFAWVVGIQRHAMAIIAQAHNRLGEDELLARRVADVEASLKRQEIELLHAAEAYVLHQGPYDAPAALAALLLADEVVSRMEGTTRFVTAGVLFEPVPGLVPELPTMRQGDMPAVTLDGVLAAGSDTYYRTRRPYPAAPYFYVQRLAPGEGVEIGRSEEVVVARFRSDLVSPSPSTVALKVNGAPLIDRSLTLQRRNAATMEVEDAAGDRKLLAHSEGLASSMARFKLLPSGDDPRRVLLAVDQPAWGLTDVPIGPVEGTAEFAARPGIAGSVLEKVPLGPAEPERFALRLGDRWLGIGPSAPPDANEPEPAAPVTAVDAPFYFDLVREGDAYEVSYVDAVDGVRRYLYVNEQVMAASDWQVAEVGLPADLKAMGSAFSEGTPGAFCSMDPAVTGRLSLDIHGGGEQAVTYRTSGRLDYSYQVSGACSLPNAEGACYLTTSGGGDTQIIGWSGYAPFLEFYIPGRLSSPWQRNFRYDRSLSPGQVHRFWCESTGCGLCVYFTTLQLSQP